MGIHWLTSALPHWHSVLCEVRPTHPNALLCLLSVCLSACCVQLQSVHEQKPKLVEAADVTDTAHHAVAAHWVAKSTTGDDEPTAGTYVFRFDEQGLIIEITSYPDAAEDEFLEA